MKQLTALKIAVVPPDGVATSVLDSKVDTCSNRSGSYVDDSSDTDDSSSVDDSSSSDHASLSCGSGTESDQTCHQFTTAWKKSLSILFKTLAHNTTLQELEIYNTLILFHHIS